MPACLHACLPLLTLQPQLLKGDRKELSLLRRSPDEPVFGLQFATNQISEGIRAAEAAAAAGADFVGE